MPTPTIKSTYSLDPRTVRELGRQARRLGTSKSEVLRRKVQSLASHEAQPESNGLQALEELHNSVDISEQGAEDWAVQVWRERAR